MTLFYVDSSAWLKRYFHEPGSTRMKRLFESGDPLASSILGYIEVASALTRQQVSRKLDQDKLTGLWQELEEDWADLAGLPLTDEVAGRALQLTRGYMLRGADAIHLATALGVKEALAGSSNALVFVAADQELLVVAQQVGLVIEDPTTAASP